MITAVPQVTLAENDWQERRRQHEQRVTAWTAPHQARAGRGEKHPVHDFLFEYYRFRPSWLNRWKIRRAARAWIIATAIRGSESNG